MTTSIVQGFINSIPDKRIARAFSEIFARLTPSKVDVALTAGAGGAKADGLGLKSTCSFHDVGTVATAADSILLPPAKEGEFHFVKNSGANSMQVFGQGDDTVDSVAAATGVPHLAGDGVMYYCLVPGNWLRIGGVSATEVFTTITATTGNITTVNATNIDAGASGTAGTVDVFPTTASKGKLILAAVDNDGNTNVTISNAAMAQASVISIPDPGAATANFLLTSAANDQAVVTATSVELNYNDITTLGTLAASKTWTSDASLDTIMPTGGLLTVQSGGAVTMNSGSTTTLSGAVVQAPVFVADATPYTVLAADSGKLHIILEQTSSITLNLPVIAAGLSYKFVMGGVATEAQNWVIVATTPSFYNGGIAWTDTNAVASPVPVYGNGTSHLTLTVNIPGAGTVIEIYSNGTEWFVHGNVISDSTPAFT